MELRLNTSLSNTKLTNVQDSSYVPKQVGSHYQELQEKVKSQGLSVGEKALLDAISKVNRTLDGAPQRFEFKLHQSTGDLVIKIYNKETNEIIREIPPEKMIDLVEKLQEIVVGAIIDEKR